jgi:hypothetical protein
MGIKVTELGDTGLEIKLKGQPNSEEFDRFNPEIERHVDDSGQVGLLLDVTAIQGASSPETSEDLEQALKHSFDVRRVAVVSRTQDENDRSWLADLTQPFTAARVRFFTENQMEEARTWIRETPKS